MDNELKPPEISQQSNRVRPSNSYSSSALAGKIANHIGTGKNAKDSFIWMTITWSFYIASGLSLLMFIKSFFVVTEPSGLLESIVEIWSIFVPIITLALGYAFGKGE